MNKVVTKQQIESALNGDKVAIEFLVVAVQDKVFGLCLKMLWNTEDAKESCQEILIKMLTHLSQFNYASKFETWVYRIAFNHLLDFKKSSKRLHGLSFESFETELMQDQIEPSAEEKKSPEYEMQIGEIRLSCTTALLQCLDSELRSAYIVGEILELDHGQASEILGISSSAFRKRLERARKDVQRFTTKVCGALYDNTSCHCSRRLGYAKMCGRVDFKTFPFVSTCQSNRDSVEFIKKIEAVKRTAAHYRSTQNVNAPIDFKSLLIDLKVL